MDITERIAAAAELALDAAETELHAVLAAQKRAALFMPVSY